MFRQRRSHSVSLHKDVDSRVPVSGFARSFVTGWPIIDATITVLEDARFECHTDSKGHFGPIWCYVGAPVTLRLEKKGSWCAGYRTTQSATIIVPPEGLDHPNYLFNVSFQVPSNIAFSLFSCAMGIAEKRGTCQIALTVTPPGKTMDDIPQGEEGVEVSLVNAPRIQPYYLGIFPGIHKTNFFSRHKSTSKDGGVIFPNVPAGVYKLKAVKGNQTSEIMVTASEDVLVNASPPYGIVLHSKP